MYCNYWCDPRRTVAFIGLAQFAPCPSRPLEAAQQGAFGKPQSHIGVAHGAAECVVGRVDIRLVVWERADDLWGDVAQDGFSFGGDERHTLAPVAGDLSPVHLDVCVWYVLRWMWGRTSQSGSLA